MARKRNEGGHYSAAELAMRAVLLLEQSRFTTLEQAKNLLMERFTLSKSQAYRIAGKAIDALGMTVTRQNGWDKR